MKIILLILTLIIYFKFYNILKYLYESDGNILSEVDN